MSGIYNEHHRALQDQFETRKLADRLEEIIVSEEFGEEEAAFIQSQDLFFLSTVDQDGNPTVSYKGGAPGFVRVLNKTTLAFPNYDGNGMYYSMGNVSSGSKVGLLFINFETPRRLRVHGTASHHVEDPLLDDYPEAEGIVRVKLTKLWVNCPRYIHKYKRLEESKYVPCVKEVTPYAGWKRVDLVQDALPPKDQGRAEREGGLQTIEEWMADVDKGQG